MTGTAAVLRDGRGRAVSYLRLSVTDRCNLSCLYCRPRDSIAFIPHEKILRYEELLDLVALACDMGITKVRLTGGEPFARRNFMDFVASIRSRFPQVDLRITTNATLLEPAIPPTAGRAWGSAPSIFPWTASIGKNSPASPDSTVWTTCAGPWTSAWRRGCGSRSTPSPCAASIPRRSGTSSPWPRPRPSTCASLNSCPWATGTSGSRRITSRPSDVLSMAAQFANLVPDDHDRAAGGPARMYRIENGAGRFGVISPLSEHFCDSCNRLRITADGKLRTCLFSDREYRLRPILRNPGLGLPKVRQIIAMALRTKPLGYEVLNPGGASKSRDMSAIGG